MPFLEPRAFDLKRKEACIHVVGATGVEGAAVISFLLEQKFVHVVGHALCEPAAFERELLASHGLEDPKAKKALLDRVRSWGIPVNHGKDYLSRIDEAEIIFAPQSWELYPENKPLFVKKDRLANIMQLYVGLAPCKTIGVTGSDGKTTTAHLIWHILKLAGRHAWLAGNYRHGPQALADLPWLDPAGFLVLEISNRHLNFGLPKTPDVAVVTNITQNHLTEYTHFEEYIETKRRILGKGTVAVLNADNPHTATLHAEGLEKRLLFSRRLSSDGAHVRDGEIWMDGKRLLSLSDIPLPGEHNVENVLAAVTVLVLLGLSGEVIQKGVQSFVSVRERLQVLGTVDGRLLVNDLAGTSMESTRRGLESFAGKSVTVVLGGAAKGVDYAPLAKTIQEQGVQVCGVRSEVTDALVMLDASLEVYETAKDALSAAYKKTPARGVILVSPAGAFFASRYLPEGLPAAISSLQWRVTPPAPKT